MKRNLYYFVCPLGEAWPWNIERLKEYWPIFNGRKIISIVYGHGLADPGDVIRSFPWPDVEFMVSENSPILCETRTYVEGLAKLESSDPDEITFYAHTKGVRHQGEAFERVKRWTDSMYLMNLGSAELVDRLMKSHCTIGCYRYPHWHQGSSWCFAGSFYWMRNKDLFSRNWTDIEPAKFGSEGYPGRHFTIAESFALTPDVPPHILYGNPPHEDEYRGWFSGLMKKHLDSDRIRTIS